jgi:hypothetical protein
MCSISAESLKGVPVALERSNLTTRPTRPVTHTLCTHHYTSQHITYKTLITRYYICKKCTHMTHHNIHTLHIIMYTHCTS